MLIIIIPLSDLKLGHVGLKTRSLGQILEKLCVPVRDTSSNDTSSTTTLRRKFLSNYQFVEK